MSHPFDLDISALEAMELDFEEQLTDEEAAKVGGGISAADLQSGELGGYVILPPSAEKEPKKNKDKNIVFTTQALGEEGGYGDVTTQALGEEGGYPVDLPLA